MIPPLSIPTVDTAFAIPGLAFGAALSQRLARRWAMRLAKRPKKLVTDDVLPWDDDYAPESVPAASGTSPLLETLDRLRVTGEVAAQDPPTGRLLRGRKAYQDQTTRVFLAI